MKNILSFILNNKRYFIIGAIIILILIARSALLTPPNTDIIYDVKKMSLIETVQVSGTYTTASQTKVNSPTNGVITEIYVQNNDVVKKGDPLFYIQSTALDSERAIAQANYLNAVSALQTAKNNQQNLDVAMWKAQEAYLGAQNTQKYRNDNTTNPATKNDYTNLEKQQIDSGVIQTQKNFNSAQQAYTTAGLAINAAQAQVNAASQTYTETQSVTVNAPLDGTIVNLLKKAGDQILANSSSNDIQSESLSLMSQNASSNPPVLVVADLNNPYVTASINEAYVPRISTGQKATIVFDALKNKKFYGEIDTMDTVGTNNSGVINYSARITINNSVQNIKPNMTALITIETFRKDNVIVVPNSAVIKKSGKTYIKMANNTELVEIEVGKKGIAKSVVTKGLTEGAMIVANPATL